MRHELSATIFWVAAACFLVAEIAIIRSAIVSRLAAASAAGPMPRVRRASEIVWALIPAVGLAVLMAFTWRAIGAAEGARTGTAIHESRPAEHAR